MNHSRCQIGSATIAAGIIALAAGAANAQQGQIQDGQLFNGAYWVTIPNFPSNDSYSNLPSVLTLTGTVRDFHERSHANGHPDFERQPSGGFGHYVGIVKDQLGTDGKPVFNSFGYRVSRQATNAQGKPILWGKSYIDSRPGDTNASVSTSTGGAVTSAASFDQWFRDVPGVNKSMAFPITLVRQPNSNRYVFDDRNHAHFSSRGGFFPIDGELFGNSANGNRNFHFSYELDTEFIYNQGAGQVFTFSGDDDVWVFIDGKLVIDIGGVHSRIEQTIELDRLNWLQDGEKYQLKFFFVERHRTQANFRIETTLQLRTIELPPSAALYD